MRALLFLADLVWGLAYRFVTTVDDALDAWGEDD